MNITISGGTNNKKKKITIIVAVALALAVILGVCFGIVLPIVNEGNQVSKVEVSKFPKLEYYVGDSADYSGLTIVLVRKNGRAEYVEYNADNQSLFSFSNFDSSKASSEQKITVEYNGFTCSYYITVKDFPRPSPVLESIGLSAMPKTEYKVGEWLNTDGGLILKSYSDGSTAYTVLINQYITGWNNEVSQTAGTYVLTVNYSEGGVLKKTTYTITVSE